MFKYNINWRIYYEIIQSNYKWYKVKTIDDSKIAWIFRTFLEPV